MKVIRPLSVLWLICALAQTVSAPSAEAAPISEPKTTHGVSYVSGGVGLVERQAMQEARKNYNLWLTFALKGGSYLANVKVTVEDANGKKILEAVSEGPWFFARLVPGQYRVKAEFQGKTLQQSATVTEKGAAQVVFYWPEE